MNPLQYAERIAYSSKETLHHTFKVAQEFNKDGALFVECGVAAGAQIIAMAYGAPKARIFALDSFKGIPLPSNRDDQMPGISLLSANEQRILPDPGKQELISSGATVVPLHDFWEHIRASGVYAGKIYAYAGWFEEMFSSNWEQYQWSKENISVLRLDGDLYNSTWVCLQHLFPIVIKGGCVIVDDWSLKGCQDACNEYFESIGYKPDWKFISTIAFFYK